MPRATILIKTVREQDWQLANEWIERWRDRMAVCPKEPGGCICCTAWWDVDAPIEALRELPPSFFASSDWAKQWPAAEPLSWASDLNKNEDPGSG